jgi:hypothetical protein
MSNHLVNFENFEAKIRHVVDMAEWQKLQKCFNTKKTIASFGHGGNYAMSEHLSVDISRLTDKYAFGPGSSVTVTSIIGDVGFEDWIKTWVDCISRSVNISETMIIGLSCSVGSQSSKAIENALLYASELGFDTFLITAKRKLDLTPKVTQIVTECIYYHTHELLVGALYYQMIYSYTNGSCPPKIRNHQIIQEKGCATCDFGDLDHSFCQPNTFRDVPPNCEKDANNIAIDFDGVIHNFDKGYHDGTCYGNPLPGALDAIKNLSEKYNVLIYSSKCLPDRPLVNGLTGKQLVVDWLTKYDVLKYVRDVTHIKPRAKIYIDDKAIRFTSWEEIMPQL